MVHTYVEPRLEQLKAIFGIRKKEVETLFSPYFYVYYKDLFEKNWGVDGFFRWCQRISNVCRVKEKKVLDLGCGFGTLSIYLALAGAREVVGIDIGEDKIGVFHKILSRLEPPIENVRAEVGDGLEIKYRDKSFDVVLVISVLSHVRALNPFISEIKRVLKKNGFLYIHDENNALNLFQTIRRRKMWKTVEYGPINDPSLGIKFSYCDVRRNMIQRRFPAIDPVTLEKLAKATAGMWGEEIYDAVEDFLRVGKIEVHPAFKYRNPETGEYPEREFNPFQVRRTLEKMGFKTKVGVGPIQRSGVFGRINHLLGLFSPISMPLAFKFDITACPRT